MALVKKILTKSASTEDITNIRKLVLNEIREMLAESIAMRIQADTPKHKQQLEDHEERIDSLESAPIVA